MTNQERINALKKLHYTEREAAFLTLAALHSGYFVRRQYSQFLGQTPGRPDDVLVGKVLSRRHGRQYPTDRRTLLYHLSSRPFYAAIGQSDNRHRRRRPPFAIKAKLMALDYVLAHPGHRYLATEDEKVGYFNRERGLPIENLPTKIYRSHRTLRLTERYFVDKFPIYASPGQDSPPVVSFCYIDGGQIATPGFETYLDQYARLFAALGRFRIIYVTTSERNRLAGAKAFNSYFGRVIQQTAQPLQPAASDFAPEFAACGLEHNYEFLETPANIWACGKSSNQ
jgi:hypothetical protein